MRKNLRKSAFLFGVRQKVVLVLLTVLLTALSVSGWLAFQNAKKTIASEVQLRGSNITRFMAKSLVYSVVGYDYHTIGLFLKEITNTDGVGYAKVVNNQGKNMGETGKLIANDPTKMAMFSQDLKLDSEVVGKVIVGVNTGRIYKRLESQKFALITREAIITILIVLGEFIALSIIIIRPVSIISDALGKNKDNELGIGRIPLYSSDEFGDLARKYNELSENLEQANHELQSKVDFADAELIKTNNLLLERSHELMDLNNKFREQSITDALTGLYNRRYFEETLAEEFELAKRHGDITSLMVIDIDHFKTVNDEFGHFNGDVVIRWIASILKERFRETDIVCRIGGEEFAVICRRADKQSSIRMAEDIRKEIENGKIELDGKQMKITVSIGISTINYEKANMLFDDVYKYADLALYYSKDHGRNCVTHYSNILN